MNNAEKRELCLSLMRADSEVEVIGILNAAELWDNKRVWRLYGDRENNFSTIGNQQNRPDAALVEKLVNSVDARLMHECMARGITPESPAAPKNIREAVARFFEEGQPAGSVFSGQVHAWPDEKRRDVARGITLAATGAKGQEGDPCLSIADLGEGQTPRKFPDTFLSLEKSNKLRIPFVQGKFNMGGTGVLEFCGKKNLQLLISRRSPRILNGNFEHSTDDEWGFTVVRREDPAGSRRSSSYTFLAPVGADEIPQNGHVMTIAAATMPLFPDGAQPYVRETEWGTLIKLYDYSLPGHRTHILRKSGLLARLELLLPELALPIRLHECRPGYGGHAGSYETTLTGLSVRLDEGGRADNIETDFPTSAPFNCAGEPMAATIFAFKKGKAETYRRTEGIIFTVNGQTHGYLTADFFRRTRVGMSYLADSILVIVDCTDISPRGRELLFMNSRDRLRDGELRKEVVLELEDVLRNQAGLKALRERRRREEIESRIEDSKPLEQILESLLKHSPTLANLFQFGNRASNPFKTTKTGTEEKPYEGKQYPTYFKFKGRDAGSEVEREAHLHARSRIAFETDAVNDYFTRSIDAGSFNLWLVAENGNVAAKDLDFASNTNLQNGIANLSIRFPATKIGDRLEFIAEVTDATQAEPFINKFSIVIHEEVPLKPDKKPGERRKPPDDKGGDERETAGGIELPVCKPVPKEEWTNQSPPFDQHTALVVKDSGVNASDAAANSAMVIYDFFINTDNVHLQRYLKSELKAGEDDRVARKRFELGMMLGGLALIHQDRLDKKANHGNGDGENAAREGIELRVAEVTKAFAPFLLPMIDALGALDEEQIAASTTSGDAT